jgi:hypothetical protein
MAATLLDSLNTLAQSFSVALTGGATARHFTATLVSPPAGEKGLTVVEEVTRSEVVEGALDLSWRTKDVRFLNTNILDPNVTGGMPISDLLSLNIGNVTNGPTSPPGVPGLLGLLSGTVPIVSEVTQQLTHAVTVEVRWRVRDESGTVVSDVEWTVGGGGPGLQGTGGEINPPLANALTPLNMVFPVIFVELTGSPVPVARRSIQAAVRLSAASVSTGFVDLPPLDVPLPVVPVPTLLLLFQHKNFQGIVLAVVPANSPLDAGGISAALGTLRTVIDPFDDLLTVLSFVFGEVAVVQGILASAKIVFRKANELKNLNDIDLDSGFFNDTEAEDELSSLIFFGPPRRQAQCFNAQNFSSSEGQMNVTVGAELLVKVADMHTNSPVSLPAGKVSVPHTPNVPRVFLHDITGFGDELSSVRFGFGDA